MLLRPDWPRRALAVALLLSVAPCWAAERVIQAGTPEGLPGYSMASDGSLMIEDSLKARVFACIEQRLKAKFIWHPLPTKRMVLMVVHGQLDLAFPLGFTAERANAMLQSAPTWDNPDVWLSLHPVNTQDKSLRIAARLGSPQQVEYAADGYTKVTGSYTYAELAKALSKDMADVVIVPRSIYEEQQALWPEKTIVSLGRQRSSGFYLQPADAKALMSPLNRAIEACRLPAK